MKNILYFFISTGILFFITGCKKNVDVDPPITGLVSSSVFSTNATAAAALTSIYARLANSGLSVGTTGISMRAGLLADELVNYNSADAQFAGMYTNNLTSSPSAYFWTEIWQEIYVANSCIEGLTASTKLTSSLKQQLLGEAKFMRAFLYFYATNLYGDIPLALTTDYRVNNTLSRSSQAAVYQQIIEDLTAAKQLLPDGFTKPDGTLYPVASAERVRPNKATATAMLARVYCFTSDWTNAEAQASSIIGNTSSFTMVANLNNVFLKNSTETIWQLQPTASGYNTIDARFFVLTSAPGGSTFPVSLSDQLKNAFETGDNRFTNWIGKYVSGTTTYYYPFKYKVYLANQAVSEYQMVLRLAEQYLIRAEAEANGAGGGLSAAVNDLNNIRNRAGLPNYTGLVDKSSLLKAILRERQVELFTEWGHRWFDLKRTGNIDAVMGSVSTSKGGSWSPYKALLPIPQSEINANQNLTQNAGYQ